MAFVKVVRRSMRPEEWTALRYGWIKKAIIDKKLEITDIEVRDAHQISENEYIYDNDYRPLKQGDVYFTPDGTAFIRGKGKVPAELLGKETYILLHTAAEMIVKINGKYAGGIDPNRDRIELSRWIREDGSFEFEIEGFNRSKPDDERNPDAMDSRGCRQIFEGAFICTVNQDMLDLYYDLTLLLDIAGAEEFDEDYRSFLNRELNEALNLVDFDTYEGAADALKYIDEHIYQNKDFRSSGDVALVGHSHLDIAYYWRRMHVVQKNARTVLIQMRLMDKYPDFKYAHTQPYVYELLKENYPELFEELKEKIKNGQFEPIGAMYVEPDCNIPCAESLIRQCLYGQLFYRREFGKTSDNAWLPDVFGNSWILPQILKKSGVDFFVSNKMSTWNDTNRFPHNNFLWKGIDGTSVYASVPPTHFITWNMPSQIMENWNAYQDKETGGQTLSMFGYGDGGSGATEEMIELMHRFDKLSIMPKTEHMSAHEFLHRNLEGNNNLSTWDGELYLEMHRGTFTTKSILKRYNRKLESKIRAAEILSLMRMITDKKEYPKTEIDKAYKKMLVNQFHDILPGSHINPVFKDAIRDYEEADKTLDNIINENGEYFLNTLNVPFDQVTFIPDEKGDITREGVRGFFAYPEIKGLESKKTEDILKNSPISNDNYGAVRENNAQNNAGSNEHDNKNCSGKWITINQRADGVLELKTPFYEAKLNKDGSFGSLVDVKTGREWVDGNFNKLHLYQDVPGMYDAWDILPNYKDVEYEFTVTEPLKLTFSNATVAEFKTVLQTPENKAKLSPAKGKSTWRVILRFFKDSPYIEVEHDVDWDEKHRLVKAEFSCNILSRELICDTSAGYIKRETHKNTTWQQARFEVCSHKWCDFAEQGAGVAIINEGKYGLGVEEKGMSLSLLRSNIRPDVNSDIGKHHFSYVILPHEGSHIEAKINEKALCYNNPLIKVEKNFSIGKIIPELKLFDGLILQAMKLSEDGKSFVIRLSEQNGCRGKVKLPRKVTIMNMLEDIEKETDEISYSPFEIITVSVTL
ncbi:MAG: alpha-mannosidase [Butyrivibrio sp.]|uniref:alpha-mannosidase n=1 Tax=Butyrivibrio sp. TaxID=28121 RepID=UPI001B1A9545|nr:glycoside hydrolase family 38 C-terminal domain-containing protein [Butyrivibrio sp.]MBO6241671.1 alpha-mannosidase [Butyrivibrio sp.]